ncbi:hypothetical protein EDD18DRAFT_1429907 [Armillaria luteobubalina]|uniref:Uncharacterized protein n=1 Tax=Armillaria luteobubalina TaxID=153913 RepID=A0AA39ULZ0_9AGAR|nr:hypothetical protein EDD18DRAFT_1429907 [Armillaria luteobubalina]
MEVLGGQWRVFCNGSSSPNASTPSVLPLSLSPASFPLSQGAQQVLKQIRSRFLSRDDVSTSGGWGQRGWYRVEGFPCGGWTRRCSEGRCGPYPVWNVDALQSSTAYGVTNFFFAPRRRIDFRNPWPFLFSDNIALASSLYTRASMSHCAWRSHLVFFAARRCVAFRRAKICIRKEESVGEGFVCWYSSFASHPPNRTLPGHGKHCGDEEGGRMRQTGEDDNPPIIRASALGGS